jgi:hypothetical protein
MKAGLLFYQPHRCDVSGAIPYEGQATAMNPVRSGARVWLAPAIPTCERALIPCRRLIHGLRIETGEPHWAPPPRLNRTGPAFSCWPHLGEQSLDQRHNFELNQDRFLAVVLNPDRPAGVGGAHSAGCKIHEITVLRDQQDIVSPMFLTTK